MTATSASLWWDLIQDIQTYAPWFAVGYVAGLLSMLAIRG